jgi:aryl-alcohol dehydrogenase-like predicted oxidoreductase
VAAELGASVPQVALAWLLHQPGVTAPIIGPRTLEQLEDLLPAAELALSAEQLERLGRWTAPPPTAPQRMLTEQVGIDVSRQPLGRSRV